MNLEDNPNNNNCYKKEEIQAGKLHRHLLHLSMFDMGLCNLQKDINKRIISLITTTGIP